MHDAYCREHGGECLCASNLASVAFWILSDTSLLRPLFFFREEEMIRCNNLSVPLPAGGGGGGPRNGSPRLSFRARHSNGRRHRRASTARAGGGGGQPHTSKANSISCFFSFSYGYLFISLRRRC